MAEVGSWPPFETRERRHVWKGYIMISRGCIVSDTHWYSPSSMPDFLYDVISGCDFVVHAGDWTDPDVVNVFSSLSVLYGVSGNCDWALPGSLPDSMEFEVGGLRVGLTHGRRRGASVLTDLSRLFPDCGLVIFGHSHVPFNGRVGGTVFFNPGSLSLPRGGNAPSYGLCEISDGEFSVRHVFL